MISAGDLRAGTNIEYNGAICTVIDFAHIKPGKGGAFAKVKLKQMKTGAIAEHTFRPEERFTHVQIYEKQYQYLYSTGDEFWFMDNETYEQINLNKDIVGERAKYLIDNMGVSLLSYDEKIIDLKLPVVVVQKITETEPGFRGDTAQGGTKPAITETGLAVQVPLFVEQDELVRIDTRTGAYLERVR
ncbi:MAG: elongation factor P [bacterium]